MLTVGVVCWEISARRALESFEVNQFTLLDVIVKVMWKYQNVKTHKLNFRNCWNALQKAAGNEHLKQ
jgi:hypothetical protein